LCYYGNGFTQEGVYRLPVHLRRFYYKELSDAKQKEKEEMDRASKGSSSSTARGPNVKVRN